MKGALSNDSVSLSVCLFVTNVDALLVFSRCCSFSEIAMDRDDTLVSLPTVCVWQLGGIFLATGSSDAVVRVYCSIGAVPEKIGELEAHTVGFVSLRCSMSTGLYNKLTLSSSTITNICWPHRLKAFRHFIIGDM